MSQTRQEFTPQEIRAIRERLGLSQLDAGTFIGGGPRAFSKYESGEIKPAAAVVNLLRILENDPNMITILGAPAPPTDGFSNPSPFEVTGSDIATLDRYAITELLRYLLSAEAQVNGLPHDGIHVSSNIDAPDGGEDGRMKWYGEPERTTFLPCRLTGFQLKAGPIGPAKAAEEVRKTDGTVKDMVSSVLLEGGTYIMLCGRSYTQQAIEARKAKIRQAVRDAGIAVTDAQIDFRDAGQIAMWVNQYPSVAARVKEYAMPGILTPFRSWNHWSGRIEHSGSPWQEDDRLPAVQAHLRKHMAKPNAIVRTLGLSGVGKSRLVLEALGSTKADMEGHFLKDLVLYTVLPEVRPEDVNAAVQKLADTGKSAIIVVDDCDPQAHNVLAGLVSRRSSGLFLITIDNDIPSETQEGTVLIVDEASPSTIDGIIKHVSPGLPSEDQERLVRFSNGLPWIAIKIAEARHTQMPVSDVVDDHMVDAFVLGDSSRDRDRLLASAQRLAAFGRIVPDQSPYGQLNEIATLGQQLNSDDLYASINRFIARGIARVRLGLVEMQPGPISMRLINRQWSDWSPVTWERVLTGDISRQLKVKASEQLALINTTTIAHRVLQSICRSDGPLGSIDCLVTPGHAEVLSNLVEIDPAVVVDLIEDVLNEVDDLASVDGELRRHLKIVLRKAAFDPRAFKAGASLMLRLELSDDGDENQSATGVFGIGPFEGLFPAFNSNTAADGNTRLRLLAEAADTDDPAQHLIVTRALLAGVKTGSFRRFVGDETHGSRPALIPWRPTWQEFDQYIRECTSRLIPIALEDDQAGRDALTGLGHALCGLIHNGFIDLAEETVQQVSASTDYWPEAIRNLDMILTYDSGRISSEVSARVSALVAQLRPTTLLARIRSVITSPPQDYPLGQSSDYQALDARRAEEVRGLTAELLELPETLSASLPTVSRGQQVMAFSFGKNLAELADSPLDWLTPIVQTVRQAPAPQRNFDLLVGFLGGLNQRHPDTVAEFKGMAAQSPELASVLPRLCSQTGVTASDILLAIQALEEGYLPPEALKHWYIGAQLADLPGSEVAPLFDAMLVHSAESFTVAVELIGSYCYYDPGQIDHIKLAVVKLAQNATSWSHWPNNHMLGHCFEQVIDLMLRKGRQDPDASATALALTKSLTSMKGFNDDWLLKPILPTLLSEYPEFSWPLIGQSMLSSDGTHFLLKCMLQEPPRFEPLGRPPILSLPEDVLFAWCHAHPNSAPAFAASILPVLTDRRNDGTERTLHPVMGRLIDEFGHRDDVLKTISNAIVGLGSRRIADEVYRAPLAELSNHTIPTVRRWAVSALRKLDDVPRSQPQP